MRMRSKLGLAAVMAASLAAATACPPPLPPDVVYVRTAPPAAQIEVIGTAPGPNYVWINGYHRWDGSAYMWAPGRWEARPHPNARWENGKWNHSSKGWYWRDGHWK